MDKKKTFRLTLFLLVTALVTVMCATGGQDQSANEPPLTANLTELSGEVKVLKEAEGAFKDAVVNTQLEEQDQVLTGEDGRVRMDLSNGTIIRLSPLSNFTLMGIENSPDGPLTRLQLSIGRLWIILKGGAVEVDTPSGLASVRGSYLHVWVNPQTDETKITCLEGDCTLGNDGGTIALVAGQTASIQGAIIPPVADKMTDGEVADWLDENPEATLVVVPLTQTVAANQGEPLPESKTNTPTPTATSTSTPTITSTPTTSGTPADCGPPDGWVLHTVKAGETMESLAALYRVEVSELQNANCRGELTFVTAGEKLYVPNVATSTPTKTPTATPEASATYNWTQTVAAGGATATPANSKTEYSGPVGPDNETITDASMCGNGYKITAVDDNGITDVKMIYTFDGSLPKRDTAISDGYYVVLPEISTDRYGVSGYIIDTTGQSTPVNIRFRFTVLDDAGYVSYYPASDAYDLTDKVNCAGTPVDVPTTYNSQTGPDGTTLSVCQQTYTVNVTEPNGVTEVKLLFNIDGTDPSYNTAVAAGDYYLMSDQGGGTYKVANIVIDTSMSPITDTIVKYRYSVKDSLGNIVLSPVYSFTDPLKCGETTYNNTTLITPPATISACTLTFSIDVADENGIEKVELQYSYVDATAPTPLTGSGSFLLPKTAGDIYSGTYSDNAVQIHLAGTLPDVTVTYKFYSTDKMGNEILLWSDSYVDPNPCP